MESNHAFVGKPWNVYNGGHTNYFPSYASVITNDPQLQISMNASGYTHKGGYTYGSIGSRKSRSKSRDINSSKRIASRSRKSRSRSRSRSKSKKSRLYYKGGRRKQRGGGLLPNELVNIPRQLAFNAESAYNVLTRNNPPTNPLPFKDQLTYSK